MRDLGVRAYRFSVAWPRVIPRDPAWQWVGIAFYDRLSTQLLAAGIEPWLCLYHWDLPRAGGRGRLDGPRLRALVCRLRALIAKRYGDRVRRFATFNEPRCSPCSVTVSAGTPREGGPRLVPEGHPSREPGARRRRRRHAVIVKAASHRRDPQLSAVRPPSDEPVRLAAKCSTTTGTRHFPIRNCSGTYPPSDRGGRCCLCSKLDDASAHLPSGGLVRPQPLCAETT